MKKDRSIYCSIDLCPEITENNFIKKYEELGIAGSKKEINPKTMQSRINKNIYFAGEIIEIQDPEGGFNLQKAFSTGWLAGKSSAMDI